MKIATWNINSVRLRLPLVQQFIEEFPVDVLCLQETKTEDATFPEDALKKMGFTHQAFAGEKSYNGVAILSKSPLSNIHSEQFIPNGKRHISAQLENGVAIHNVYIPAGGDIPDVKVNPKFQDKLNFVDALKDWSQAVGQKGKSIILGDMNIAPQEHDVWSHKQLLGVVSHTPIEVDKMMAFKDSIGWVDSARQFTPDDEKLYSWWSYRARDWLKSNRGRRLDHIWLTPDLKSTLQGVETPSHIRGWEKPSDHVPVIAEIAA